MRTLFLFSGGRKKKLELVQSGEAPTDFYYGYCEWANSQDDVGFMDISEVTQGTIPARLINHFYYRWQVLPCRTTGDLITILYRILPKLNTYDVIVATTTGLGFSLEMLRRVGLLKSPVLTIHCGVMNYRYNALTKLLTGHLLRRGSAQVFGHGELEGMREGYDLSAECIELNEFGVDTKFWNSSRRKDDDGYVLAVGNSGRRDYDLLMRVALEIEAPVKLVNDESPSSIPDNVSVIRGRMFSDYELPDTELRELYEGAAVVVIPLTESLQPAGQSVALQAMACGKAVVITNTQGLWNPFLMDDGRNCALVPSTDKDAMVMGIQRLLSDSELRRRIGAQAVKTVEQYWEISQFSERVRHACERIHRENYENS